MNRQPPMTKRFKSYKAFLLFCKKHGLTPIPDPGFSINKKGRICIAKR